MSATDEIRRMLDERGVEWIHSDGTGWPTTDYIGGYGQRCSVMGEKKRSLTVVISGLTPEQAIAATLVSPVNTFTLDEIEDLYQDLCDSDGGSSMAIVDGVRYETDWGYGVDAVRHFTDMLRRRHGIEVDG